MRTVVTNFYTAKCFPFYYKNDRMLLSPQAILKVLFDCDKKDLYEEIKSSRTAKLRILVENFKEVKKCLVNRVISIFLIFAYGVMKQSNCSIYLPFRQHISDYLRLHTQTTFECNDKKMRFAKNLLSNMAKLPIFDMKYHKEKLVAMFLRNLDYPDSDYIKNIQDMFERHTISFKKLHSQLFIKFNDDVHIQNTRKLYALNYISRNSSKIEFSNPEPVFLIYLQVLFVDNFNDGTISHFQESVAKLWDGNFKEMSYLKFKTKSTIAHALRRFAINVNQGLVDFEKINKPKISRRAVEPETEITEIREIREIRELEVPHNQDFVPIDPILKPPNEGILSSISDNGVRMFPGLENYQEPEPEIVALPIILHNPMVNKTSELQLTDTQIFDATAFVNHMDEEVLPESPVSSDMFGTNENVIVLQFDRVDQPINTSFTSHESRTTLNSIVPPRKRKRNKGNLNSWIKKKKKLN
jgi:hypothetical protein